jgi:fatty-acyl-CoA synthase
VLVTAAAFKTSNYLGMLQNLGVDADGRSARLPQLRHVVRMGDEATAGMRGWPELLAGRRRAWRRCRRAASSMATTPSTSSSPAAPPAPQGRHADAPQHRQQRLLRGGALHALTHDDALCIPVPLYHCFGMVLAVLACVSRTGARWSSRARASTRGHAAAVQAERCTALHGVPTMFIAELDHPDFARSTCRRCAPASWPARPARSR